MMWLICWILAAQGSLNTTDYIHTKINVSLRNNYTIYNTCTQSSLLVALEISQCVWYKQSFYTYLSTFKLLGISSFIANDVLPQCLAWLLTDSEACGIRYYLLKQCTRRLRWRLASVDKLDMLNIWCICSYGMLPMVIWRAWCWMLSSDFDCSSVMLVCQAGHILHDWSDNSLGPF